MGIRGSKMAFLRPPYRGDSERNFRVFEAAIPWGKGQARTAGKQRERDRVRERYRKRKTLRVFQIGELYLRIVKKKKFPAEAFEDESYFSG